MPKRFSRGWLLACAFACLSAQPLKPASREDNYGLSGDYDFEDFTPEKYVEKVEAPAVELSDLNKVPSTTARNDYVVFARPLEPDAEMLPAHYTGVRPPGVDHMEITVMDSAGLGSSRKNSLLAGPTTGDFKAGVSVATAGEASRGAKGEKGILSAEAFVKGAKGEKSKESQKAQYAKEAGKKTARDETERHFKGREDEASGAKSASYDLEGHREKGRNAAGYHNVYHRDEYKKDADFYDNDRQAGRFHKHGHYDEKHVASEGDFRKGGSENSGYAEAEAAEKGRREKGRSSEEASGHAAKSGYEGFFGKLDEFAKNVGSAVGQAFGKGEGPAKGQ